MSDPFGDDDTDFDIEILLKGIFVHILVDTCVGMCIEIGAYVQTGAQSCRDISTTTPLHARMYDHEHV